MDGWIKIHRKILDNWVSEDRCNLGAWIVMLVSANYTPVKIAISGKLIEIRKGQLFGDWAGFAQLLFGESDNIERVQNFFAELENDGMIEMESIGSSFLVTIKNYNKYQLEKTSSESVYNIYNIIKEEEKKRIWDGDVVPIIEQWLRYKSERRESYKPIGIKMFIQKLHELSKGNVDAAQAIVYRSMSNNWAGVFDLPQEHKPNQQQNNEEKAKADYDYYMKRSILR